LGISGNLIFCIFNKADSGKKENSSEDAGKNNSLYISCTFSAIKNDKSLRSYFERKVMGGKNKMSVINTVRNKLIHRVYGIVRDERKF
jgi:hypothetical protein